MTEKDCSSNVTNRGQPTRSTRAQERSQPSRSARSRSSDYATDGRQEATTVAELQAALNKKERIIAEQKRWLTEKSKAVAKLQAGLEEKGKIIAEQKKWMNQESKTVAKLQAALDEKNMMMAEQERRLVEMENEKHGIIDEHGRTIKGLSHELTMTKLELIEAPVLGDDELTEGWRSLDFKITQLIKRAYDYRAQKNVDPAALESVFSGLSGKHLLTLRSHRLYLLKTYIWTRLTDWVFGHYNHIWAGKANRSFANLCFNLEVRTPSTLVHVSEYTSTNPDPTGGPLVSLGEYAKWFSRTSMIMETVYKQDATCGLLMRDAAGGLQNSLRPFQKDPGAVSEGLARDLLQLVEAACELDFKMARAGAHYRLFIFDPSKTLHQQLQRDSERRFGMDMDASIMEDATASSAHEGPSAGTTVEMVVSPGIIKIGAGSGSEFDVSSVLVKSQVICAKNLPVERPKPGLIGRAVNFLF